MKKQLVMHLLLAVILMCTFSTLHAATRYVKPTASGTGDGSSWANASADLQAMINASADGDEVWVAAGTYKPTTGTDRAISFSMKNGVAIYGGFNGTETLLNQRDFSTNVTILSGDLNGDDVVNSAQNIANNGENSYQVVANRFTAVSPLSASAVLDGFTITGGNNRGQFFGDYTSGGGMYNRSASPTLSNIIFVGNSAENGGGGLMNTLNCSPTLTNVTFDRNYSQNNGGGLYNFTGANTTLSNVVFKDNFCYGSFGGGGAANFNNSSTFNNCEFSDNFASNAGAVVNIGVNATFTDCSFNNNGVFQSAGGMYVESSTVNLFNCVFSKNRATNFYAGAIYVNSAGTVNATNCVFYGNSAGNTNPYNQSGVMFLTGTNPAVTIQNSILWSNQSTFLGVQPTVTYSIVQGGYSGIGNLNADPLFVNSANGDLRLQACSPAIDAGSNAAVPGYITTDLDGNPRFYNGTVDMGPYELQGGICCPAGNVLYVSASAAGSNDGTSWANAFNDLQDALALAGCANVSEIWVAAGTYKPTIGTDRNSSFVMENGVAMYGGFNGTETMLSQREWAANETILSGDIGAQGDKSDNSYTVVTGSGTNSTAVIDGFTITLGHADAATGDHTNPNRSGGGMYNNNGSPMVLNCTFSGNWANSFGGGMFNEANSSLTVTNCTFSGNWAGLSGGGMYNISTSPTVTNCTFLGNSANNFGGGMYNISSSPTVTNCTFSGNTTNNGGGMYNNFSSSPTVTNCIIWGNSTAINNNNNSAPVVSFSIVQGGYAGTGNLDVDPLFVNQPPVGLGTGGGFAATRLLTGHRCR